MKDLFGGDLVSSRQPDEHGHYWVGIGSKSEHCMRCMRSADSAAAECPGPPGPYEEFCVLRNIWKRDTSYLSGGREEHWAYQQIISRGAVVVPFILAELRDNPDHWSDALMAITGECPDIPEEDHGRLLAVAEHWLKWGEARGLIARNCPA